jgi:hypothetical protein
MAGVVSGPVMFLQSASRTSRIVNYLMHTYAEFERGNGASSVFGEPRSFSHRGRLNGAFRGALPEHEMRTGRRGST